MIDILIPLGRQSPFDNEELRYCLRAIEKNLKGYRDIYLIGEKPHWITNVKHVEAKDESSHEVNIMRKIITGCNIPELSDDFIFFNDDHFLIKEVDAITYPYYYYDDLWRKVIGSSYRESCNNTRNVLLNNGKGIKHFDIHCPIVYNKDKFKKCMNTFDWKVRSGYIIKSLYCNIYEIEGEEMKDCKFIADIDQLSLQSQLVGRHVFSCGDLGFPASEKYLKTIYSKKSKYEL